MYLRRAPACFFACFACSALVCGGRLHAQTVALIANKDNTLIEPVFFDPLSNGAGTSVFVGKTGSAGNRRAVLHFDLAPVPRGATIQSVQLQLYCTREISGNESVSVRRLLAPFGEGASISLGAGGQGAPAEPGDATWEHAFFPGTFWTNLGGDFAAAIATSTTVGPADLLYTWPSSANFVADAQVWLDDPSSNFGIVLIGNEEAEVASAKRFASRESTTDPRPTLIITYTGGVLCDPIDFNRDGVSPDSLDIEDYLSVFSGGPCSNDPPTGTGCGDIDFNNDGVSPDSTDIETLLRIFSGGYC